MKKHLLNIIVISVVLVAATLSAGAITFDDIQFWVGNGSNQAVLVIDWNDGVNPESLAWGFKWDGSATGADMITAVDAADSRLSIDGSVGSFGLWINGIAYNFDDSLVHNQVTAADWSQSWSYWTNDNAPASDWSSSWIGASDRMLANNSWDGWSFTGWDANYNPVSQPGNATAAAVPEPGSMAGLLMGMVSLGGYVKRRRK